MEISTRMITSAATFDVLKPPMRLLPPTISAIGRAISWKLIKAPPMAMASTRPEMKNWLSDDDDNVRTARSVCFWMPSYSSICRSMTLARASRLLTLRSTRSTSCSRLRQCGIIALRCLWRSSIAARYCWVACSSALISEP